MSPDFNYLTIEEQGEIEDAFDDAEIIYDDFTRQKLTQGINRRFVSMFMRNIIVNPNNELLRNVMRLSRTKRLNDNTVPLIQWLQNTCRMFKIFPEVVVLEQLLDKVSKEGEPTSVALFKSPTIQTDEIITDDIDDLMDISFLAVGAKRADGVARITVPRYENGNQILYPQGNPYYGYGTVWLIASDLIFTNHHVIRNRTQTEPIPQETDIVLQAQNSKVQFFYDAENQAGLTINVKELVAAARTEDFALLRLEETPKIDILPIFNQIVALPPTINTPKGTVTKVLSANIIQHANGDPKRVALRNNLIYEAEYPLVHYYADTLQGSSGSPVFDDAWRVIALHRAAVPKLTQFNGRNLGYVNEGVQMHSILARLEALAQANPNIQTALNQIKTEQKFP